MSEKPTMTCPECGVDFTPQHHRHLFCIPAHSRKHANRQLARGQAIISLAQVWRGVRDLKGPANKAIGRDVFAKLCRLADAANAEDRAAGRLSAVNLYRRRTDAGLLD